MSITQTRVTSNSVQFMDSSSTVAASVGGTTVNFGDEDNANNLNFLSVDGHNNTSQSSNNNYHGFQLDGGRANSTPTMRLLTESGKITSGKRTAQFLLGDLQNNVDGAFTVHYQETVGDPDTETDPVQESLAVTLGGGGTNTLTINENASNGGGHLTLTNGTITNSGGTISFDDENLTTTGQITCGDPTSAGHAATKSYVDNVAQGLDVKASVRVATTGNGTLASAFANGETIDGVALSTGDRILIKDQTDASENGVYVVAASGAPARATDFDSDGDTNTFSAGAFMFVEEGTANANKGFVLTTAGGITVGDTDLDFTQFSSAGAVTLSTLGVTATASELNILDGVTSTTAELNILDGVTSTTAELNILDGVTATASELNLLDGSVAGTVVSGKAAVYGSDGELNTNLLQIGGSDITASAAELNIMDGDTSATATTLADADRVVVNDAGTMKQVALTDFETYFESALDTLSNVTTVGALDAGSITSNFGSIDIGSSTLTAGVLTAATNSTIGTLTLADGSITDSNGTISFGDDNITTSGSITSTSDARLKENVVEMTDAVAKVQRLRGVDFTWKASGKADAGVIAQEVEAVAPHWVAENAEGTKAVDYGKLTSLLIQAVKEQQATIDQLRQDVAALRAAGQPSGP